MKRSTITLLTTLFISTGLGLCWAADVRAQAPTPTSAAVPALSDGEVRKVDANTRKITLKHGEIKHLGMPGMTMVFQVKDPTLLDKVKPGDKVRFTAEKINGAFTVTTLEAVP
ncbi:MAG: copper-binding protein [Pseudomonadota bacterium]